MSQPVPKPRGTAEKNEAVREKLRRMGLHVPPKDAWKSSYGSMKDSEHFVEAIRLGAEWRAEVNRKSLLGEDADS